LTNKVFFDGASMPSFGGGFGAGAAASTMLGLDAQQIRYMLSYIAQQTAGARSWQRDQDHMEKAFVFGVPARNGVTAALLAQAGYTGVDDVFSGKFNFLERYTDKPDLIHLTRDLGTVNEIMNTSMKKFCVGGPIQAPLEGLSTLISQGTKIEDIVKIDAHVPSKHAYVVDNSHNPSICLQHVLALLMVDGKFTFESIHDIERLKEPAVLRQRAKVNLIYDTEMDKVEPRRPVHVTVTLTDGSSRTHKADAVRGTMYFPFRWDEVVAKATELMVPVVGEARTNEICDIVAGIDKAANVQALAKALAK
jgi:2-methylcitrate dehydratase PrpD